MSLYVKAGGQWVNAENCFVKAAGNWEEVSTIYEKKNGVWNAVWESNPPPTAAIPATPYTWIDFDILSLFNDAKPTGYLHLLLKFRNEMATSHSWARFSNDIVDRPKIQINNDSFHHCLSVITIGKEQPTLNYSSYSTTMRDSFSGIERLLISFDISGLEASSVTLKVQYEGYNPSTADPAGKQLSCYKQIHSDISYSQVTWNQYKTGTNWIIPGGDYVSV